MARDHLDDEEFANERLWGTIFREARGECSTLKASTMNRIMAHFVSPEYMENLFAVRPCVRRLKYIGCFCEAGECECSPDEFFEIGKEYRSVDFNGGTYSIEGYPDRIGCVYFEWCDDADEDREGM